MQPYDFQATPRGVFGPGHHDFFRGMLVSLGVTLALALIAILAAHLACRL